MVYMNYLASKKQQTEAFLISLSEATWLPLLGSACLHDPMPLCPPLGNCRSLSSTHLFFRGQERLREVLRFLALRYAMSKVGSSRYILRYMTW